MKTSLNSERRHLLLKKMSDAPVDKPDDASAGDSADAPVMEKHDQPADHASDKAVSSYLLRIVIS